MYKLLDAVARNKETKGQFGLPHKKEVASVDAGNLVKLVFLFKPTKKHPHIEAERMWVKVIKKTPKTFVGVLDNTPFITKSIKLGDKVRFRPKNIIQVWNELK